MLKNVFRCYLRGGGSGEPCLNSILNNKGTIISNAMNEVANAIQKIRSAALIWKDWMAELSGKIRMAGLCGKRVRGITTS